MSTDHALPHSTDLERDARAVSRDHKVDPSEIAMGVIIGRTSEFFDFFVFGIACVLVGVIIGIVSLLKYLAVF